MRADAAPLHLVDARLPDAARRDYQRAVAVPKVVQLHAVGEGEGQRTLQVAGLWRALAQVLDEAEVDVPLRRDEQMRRHEADAIVGLWSILAHECRALHDLLFDLLAQERDGGQRAGARSGRGKLLAVVGGLVVQLIEPLPGR